MNRHTIALSALLCIVPACGETVDVSFGSLQGSYSYQSGRYTCSGRVSGSHGSGECVKPSYEDSWGDYAYWGNRVWDFDLTLTDSRIAATITEVHTSNELDASIGRCTRELCVDTTEVSMSKTSGRADTGQMAALAGVWEGSASSERVCHYVESDGLHYDMASCEAALRGRAGRETSRRIETWTASADLFGKVGSVTYAWQGTDYWDYDESGNIDYNDHDDPYEWGDGPNPHHVSVTATDGGVVVDDTLIPKG